MNLDTFLDVDKFTAEVNEEMSDITEAMRTQTARAAFYGICHSKAKRQAAKVGLLVKSIEAKLTTIHRKKLNEAAAEEAEATGQKPEKVTVDMVKAAVMLDPNMRKFLEIQLEADEIETICMVARDAFRTRSMMIQSLGNLTRDQLRSNVQIQSAREAISGYDSRRAQRASAARPTQREGDEA